MVERLVDEPNLGDALIEDYVQGLKRVINLHKRLFYQGYNPDPFYPPEVLKYTNDFKRIENSWRDNDYDSIYSHYIQCWIDYVYDVSGEYPYHTIDEFLQHIKS